MALSSTNELPKLPNITLILYAFLLLSFGTVKGQISPGLSQMTSLVPRLLTQVQSARDHLSTKQGQAPSWFKPEDQKLLGTNGVAADAVVASDGTGTFNTISHALSAAPDNSSQRYVIYIKKGVYYEYVEINKTKWNITMIGDGMDATIISGNRSYGDGWDISKSPTFAVDGPGFIAQDITFQNTAGPQNHQAVALRSSSHNSVLFRCGIYGYQDSLYAQANIQFYRECKISGTVDFIFGDATAVFQNCQILVKKGLPGQKNTITAQGRFLLYASSGFSFQFCNITADSDLLSAVYSTQTYLGRPWKEFSRTIFMQSYLSDIISPEGWLEWEGKDFGLDTLYYAEYMNHGPGAELTSRVNWPGYHELNDSSQAINFTVARFIHGNSWLPSTGVTYTAGLG